MKNIVIFTNTLKSGGAEKQAILLAKALQNNYIIWLVVYYGDQYNQRYIDYLNNNNINTIYLYGHHLKKIIFFYNFLKKQKIDIIFSYLVTTNFLGSLVGRIVGVKYTIGGIRSSILSNKKIFLQRFIHNYINTFTIINNYKGRELLIKQGFLAHKIKVITNCYIAIEKPIKRQDTNIITILSVGRFCEAKDYFTAIKAISILKQTEVNFKYIIIGYGELENEIRKWVKIYNVQNKVEIIINPDNLNGYYKNADIYLMTSLFEGLSNTVLEAMGFSLPLVVTNVGDNNKLVQEGKNGFLCEIGDAEYIAEKLIYLINNYEERIKFGELSYKIVSENYSFDKFQSNYINFIESLNID